MLQSFAQMHSTAPDRSEMSPFLVSMQSILNQHVHMQVRLEVFQIQDRLADGLRALAGAASGSRSFTLEHLEEFLDLVLPLLGSPLVCYLFCCRS